MPVTHVAVDCRVKDCYLRVVQAREAHKKGGHRFNASRARAVPSPMPYYRQFEEHRTIGPTVARPTALYYGPSSRPDFYRPESTSLQALGVPNLQPHAAHICSQKATGSLNRRDVRRIPDPFRVAGRPLLDIVKS